MSPIYDVGQSKLRIHNERVRGSKPEKVSGGDKSDTDPKKDTDPPHIPSIGGSSSIRRIHPKRRRSRRRLSRRAIPVSNRAMLTRNKNLRRPPPKMVKSMETDMAAHHKLKTRPPRGKSKNKR